MESITHPFPLQKRRGSFPSASNGGACSSQKSAYDDVLGGSGPKFDLPILAPRQEDYAEIFGGFHASRSSCIPILNLPHYHSEFHFDLRGPSFDYAEIFSELEVLDPAPSFDDVVGQSGGGGFEYDSSCSDHDAWSPSQSAPLLGAFDPLSGPDQMGQRLSHGSRNKSPETTVEFNVSYNKSSERMVKTVLTGHSSVMEFDDHCKLHVGEDVHCSNDFGRGLVEEKRCGKPSHGGFNACADIDLAAKCATSTPGDKSFVTVTDISLRTKPSPLPPPSRPPPALVVTNYAFEEGEEDSAPLFFDVKVDAGTSSDERHVSVKNDGFKESVKPMEEKRKTANVACSSQHSRMLHVKERTGSPSSVEDRSRSSKNGEETSESQGGDFFNYDVYVSAGTVACREETEYLEGIDRNISTEAFEMKQQMSLDAFRHLKTTDSEVSDRNQEKMKFESTEETPRWDEERNHAPNKCSTGNNQKIEKPSRRMSDENECQDKEMRKNPTACMKPQVGNGESGEEQLEIKCNMNGVETKSELNATSKPMEIEKQLIDHEPGKENNQKHKEDPVRKECRRQSEDLGLAEIGGKEHTEHAKLNGPGGKENDNKLKQSHVVKENGSTPKECNRNEEIGQNSFIAVGDKKQERLEVGRYKKKLMNDAENEVNVALCRKSPEHDGNNNEEKLDSEWELHEANGNAPVREHNRLRLRKPETDIGFMEENFKTSRADAGSHELSGEAEEIFPFERNGHEKEMQRDSESHVHVVGDQSKVHNVSCKLEKNETVDSGKQINPSEAAPIPFSWRGNVESDSRSDDWRRKAKGSKVMKDIDVMDSETARQVMMEPVVDKSRVQNASSILNQNGSKNLQKHAATQRCERKDKNMEDSIFKDQKVRERIRTETKMETEHIRKLEEEREREREREKDRMAVDKSALERSYSESRERAERAAVERATAEVRQRALAEARERLEKASTEARFRAECSAVERAAAEVRQRAAEKSMAENLAFVAGESIAKPISDRFSAPSRFGDPRQSEHFQNIGLSNGLRYPYSSVNCGADGESPQRCKARLDRYRRTAERAANALAEKNRRDLLTQRESEERNRIAETLDAEIKRWSNGKEGNLRALLSTLQYILGPDNGWQPVPLTEVITSAAVKKAYRRATLCVHPDKLQQRGATIHQKYICEKVFDLLKEAWSKFNSEER